MNDFLKQLNREQLDAVVQTDGPIMVIAGAGSGKTRVLTYRIAYLLSKGVDPFNILSLTFTNKAAREMKERVIRLIGDGDARNVWLDGMEVTQFTYFQQVGGLACDPVAVEITYGTERLAMYLQGVDNIFDIVWNKNEHGITTYKDIHLESEIQFSKYNFELADTKMLFNHFNDAFNECKRCLEADLPLPAYDQCMMASHAFNTLDARKAISVTERQNYILKVRELSQGCAVLYKEQEPERLKRLGY